MSVDPPAAEWAILTRKPRERSEVLAADLKPQSEQVQSFSEHVHGFAAQYEREQKQLAA